MLKKIKPPLFYALIKSDYKNVMNINLQTTNKPKEIVPRGTIFFYSTPL